MKLHDYQEDMAGFVVDRLSRPGLAGAGLFADLGVGKTAATLTALDRLFAAKEVKRCLVIGPLRVIAKTWPDEIKLWSPRLNHHSLHKPSYSLRPPSRRHIEFQSCDSIHRLVEHAGRWDCVVVDESYNFKTWTTRRMRSLRQILKKTPKRIILTGTPTAESLADLHSQIYILDGGEALGKNVTVFRAKYMEKSGYMGRQWKMRSGTEDEILQLVAPLVMRVDAETHLDMPELIEHNVEVLMPPKIKSDYARLKRELYMELENDRLLVGNAAALYTKLKQLCNGQVYYDSGERRWVNSKRGRYQKAVMASEVVHDVKVSALKDITGEMYGKHAIIFYQFTHDRDRIVDTLGERNCRIIYSGMKEASCASVIDDWNSKKFRFLVTHPDCVREGLNLQHGGSDMIWFGIPDRANQYIQARGRLYRQGQKDQVRMHRLVMPGTVEDLQIDRLDGKIGSQDKFLDALKQHAKG